MHFITVINNLYLTGKSSLQRDFGSLNRRAVDAGLVTAQEHHAYRKGHDLRRSMRSPAPVGEPEDGITAPPTRVAGIPSGEPVVRVLRGSGNTLRSSLFHLERSTEKMESKPWVIGTS